MKDLTFNVRSWSRHSRLGHHRRSNWRRHFNPRRIHHVFRF